MLLRVLLSCAVMMAAVAKIVPTKGMVWPKPRNEERSSKKYVMTPSFKILVRKVSKHTCKLIDKAIARYTKIFMRNPVPIRFHNNARREYGIKEIVLTIELTKNSCDDLPYLGMNENYILNVSESSNLRSSSMWGILRGLETFAQLLYLDDDYKTILVAATYIDDGPKYRYRGLMLDTGRNFISVDNILLILDGMSMNKMNVFHWHIVDDESFPYQSQVLPELSAQGALYYTLVYTKEDIQKVVNYATDRGIIVIPEFNVPGAYSSLRLSHSELFTGCGTLNPLKEETYNFLRILFREVQTRFPGNYFHLGGKGANMECWINDVQILKIMKDNNNTEKDLLTKFHEKSLNLLRKRTIPIVWDEMFNATVIKDRTIVQVSSSKIKRMAQILEAGHPVIYSGKYYDLSRLSLPPDSFYLEPEWILKPKQRWTLLENLLGGEALMWGQFVDDNNVLTRVWPAASIVAEALWSGSPPRTGFTRDDSSRLEEHYCRMRRRGVPSKPPNYEGGVMCIH